MDCQYSAIRTLPSCGVLPSATSGWIHALLPGREHAAVLIEGWVRQGDGLVE
jgi:hypothetical protein